MEIIDIEELQPKQLGQLKTDGNSNELKLQYACPGNTIISNGRDARIFVGNITVGKDVNDRLAYDLLYQANELVELLLILLIFFVIFKIAEFYQ